MEPLPLGPAAQDLSDWASWALNERCLAPKTVKEYGWRIAHARRWLASTQRVLEAASSVDLKEYLFRGVKPTPRMRNLTRCALVAYGDWLMATGARADNPARDLPRQPEPRRLPRPLHPAVLPAIRRQAAGLRPWGTWQRGSMLACLIVVYVHTGLRLNEVRTLRWSQISDSAMCIAQKGGDEHLVFLHDEPRRALREWQTVAPASEWVFPSPVKDGPISGGWIETKIREVGDQVGAKLWPHRFRHTFATELLRSTGRVEIVQQALGHRSLLSTMVYTAVCAPDVGAAVRQLTFDSGETRLS